MQDDAGVQEPDRQFWGRHIWARGYFAASSGNVTDEVIITYIEAQGQEPPGGTFKVDDELSSVSSRPVKLPA